MGTSLRNGSERLVPSAGTRGRKIEYPRHAEDKELIIEARGRYAQGLDDQGGCVTGCQLYPEYTYNALKAVDRVARPRFYPGIVVA